MQNVLKKKRLYSTKKLIDRVQKAIRVKNSYSNLLARHLFNIIKSYGEPTDEDSIRINKEDIPYFVLKKKGNDRVVLLKIERPIQTPIVEYNLTNVLITIEDNRDVGTILAERVAELIKRVKVIEGEEEAIRLQKSMCTCMPFMPFEDQEKE